jgi:hypothetical protein
LSTLRPLQTPWAIHPPLLPLSLYFTYLPIPFSFLFLLPLLICVPPNTL